MLILHAGNRVDAPDRPSPRFPEASVDTVEARIARLLRLMRPSAVVTSAAAGADLLVCEQSLAQRIPLHVVLPVPRDEFLVSSVADLGDAWVDRYHRVIERLMVEPSCSLSEYQHSADDDGYLAVNEHLVRRARSLAGDEVLVLAIRPYGGEEPPSITDHLVSIGILNDWFLIEVDPQCPGRTAPIAGHAPSA